MLHSAVKKRNVHGVNVAVVVQRSTGSWSTLDMAGQWTIREVGPNQFGEIISSPTRPNRGPRR